jgi:hypothetical protein
MNVDCVHRFLAHWTSTINPITFSNVSLIQLLNTGGYAIISADRNPAMTSNEFHFTDRHIRERIGNLSSDLTDVYVYSTIVGVYDGAKETSFFVVLHNDEPENERQFLYRLGEKYNQDSIIYVKRAQPVRQELIYTTGPFNGTYVEGQGYQILLGNTTDNYSRVQLCPYDQLIFTLNFDFECKIISTNVHVNTRMLVEHHARNRMNTRLR